MLYGENGTVKFLETLTDNVFRHTYSMMQILKKKWENFGVTQATPSLLISNCEINYVDGGK
jgi:transcriptional/translational regulatory protein YebC/TACO1